jgi:penicillin amidase
VPVPAVAAHDWTGWVDLPGRHVAPHEHLVTANHRMPGFEAIGVDFASPARAERIDTLLAERDDLTVADCEAVHADVLAGQPAHLHQALAGLEGLEGPGEKLRLEILAWDQHFDADSRGAALYVAVRDELVRLVADDPALGRLGASPYPRILAPWMDVPLQVYLSLDTLLSPEGLALLPHREELVRAAVTAVAEGSTPHAAAATWGERHRFRPPHALDADGFRAPEAGPPLPGDNDCVRCAGQVPGTDVAVRGSVARYAWDLTGLAASGWVVPGGAHGRAAHPHHRDQQAAWVDARLLPVIEGDEADEAGTGMERVTPDSHGRPFGGP